MYVAITRAKKSVTLSYAQTRFRWGNHVSYPPSRFLKEIDPKYLNWPDLEREEGISGKNLVRVATTANTNSPIKGANTHRSTSHQSTNPDFVPDPVSKLKEGQRVEHDRFGFGQLVSLEGDPLNLKAIVDFEQGGRKVLLLKFAKLRVVE